ncbi:MAG: histidinol phosphate phosphatase [Chloroflexota bacterium]|nr:MAG: histidinol phosphate phosphatase [Chloroflexota bacterium]
MSGRSGGSTGAEGTADAGRSAARPSGATTEPATEPADRDLPLDSHLHTRLSHDSDVPLDVYPALAVARGIAEIAITDHLDFDPRVPTSGVPPTERERLVRELAERWADRVAVRYGAEITYERRFEAEIHDHLRRHRYDFVIGSVHVGADSPYRPERVATFVAGRSLREIVAPYYDEVLAAARSGLFDTLGHLDFVKRYLVPHVPPSALAAAPELVEPILRALVESGTGLEINASGLRQAAGEPYPHPTIIARYRALGGERITVGSDAHRAHHFAAGLRSAYALVASGGWRSVHFRRGPSPVAVTIPPAILEAVAGSGAPAGSLASTATDLATGAGGRRRAGSLA